MIYGAMNLELGASLCCLLCNLYIMNYCMVRPDFHKRSSVKRIISYGVIGVLAFTVEYGSFTILIHVLKGSMSLLSAQSLSFCLGLVTSFTGNRLFTFNTKDRDYVHSVSRQMGSYMILALVNLCLTNVVIFVLVHHTNIGAQVAKLIVMLMVVLWNFLIFHKLIFKTE